MNVQWYHLLKFTFPLWSELNNFSCSYWYFKNIFFGEMSVQIFCPVLLVFWLLIYMCSFCTLEKEFFITYMYCKYFLPDCGIAILGKALTNINNLRYADDTTIMAESEEELKSLLMKVKEESEKVGLNSTFSKLRSWHPVPSLHGKEMGRQWKHCQTLFWGAPKSLQMVTAAMKLKDVYSLEGKLWPT